MLGILCAAAIVLVVSGAGKLHDPTAAGAALRAAGLPGPRRVSRAVARGVGLAEVLAGVAVVALGGRWAAGVVLVAHLSLAAFAVRLLRVAPEQGCGCIGRSAAPVSRWHVLVDLTFAGAGAVTLLAPPVTLLDQLGQGSVEGGLVLTGSALLAYTTALMMTALPDLDSARRGVGAR